MSDLALLGGPKTITETWPKWPMSGQRERELLNEVLSGDLWGGTGLGPKIREVNEKFARYCGVAHGAAVANGTVSMELCLRAWGIGPGDEVIVPAFTFFATAVAVHSVGATVVYVDIDPKTLNIDVRRMEEAVTGKTRAVIPVHIAGHPADMDPIVEVARKHGIKVLEDAAQAHGAVYKGRKVGSLGDAASFSFQQSKNLQSGEGGIIVSDDGNLVDRIHYSLGKFGRGIREKYSGHVHYVHGINACYSEIQAAVLLAQFERFEEQMETRVAHAARLRDLLGGIPGIEPLPVQPYCNRHGYHLFLFYFDPAAFEGISRAQFFAALHAEGVPCMSLYPMPLYRQPVYETDRRVSMRFVDCPVTERAAREIGFFEHHLLLARETQVERLAEAVRKVRDRASELCRMEASEKDFMGSAVLTKARNRAGS